MKAGKRNNMALSEYTIAEHNHLAVYAHPMFGSNNYLPDWLRNSGYSDDELMEITKERIRIILTRYKGRIDIVDVYNEGLSRSAREWREKDNLFISMGYEYNQIQYTSVFYANALQEGNSSGLYLLPSML